MNLIIRRAKQFSPMLFVMPALVFYIVFLVIPIIRTFQFSFFSWNGASPVMQFVGLQNYTRLLQDELFWKSLGHNLIWIVSTVIIPVFIGLILAILISTKGIKFRLFFRVTYFMPVIVSLVAVGIIWNWIYHPEFGVINEFLRAIGLGQLAPAWLGDEDTVLPALIIAGSWTYYGFCMVIFLAAIQGIDKSYYEVAKLEGANFIQTFVNVTVPLLKKVEQQQCQLCDESPDNCGLQK
jgi:raffinose/stachyose/melibiose transport system permease protein